MNKRGFTLVEVLVSASLLAALSFSFFYLAKNSSWFQKKAGEKMQAAYALQAKMEELKSLSFESLKLQNGKDGVKVIPIDSNLVEVRAGEIYTLRAR